MGNHDKDCEMYFEACGCESRRILNEALRGRFRDMLFSLQPHEVVLDIFDYFGLALSSAPNSKVEEFFIHFSSGVRESLAAYKNSNNISP